MKFGKSDMTDVRQSLQNNAYAHLTDQKKLTKPGKEEGPV